MIYYTVTVRVPLDLVEDWRTWMLAVHIPDVLATGQWEDGTLLLQLEPAEADAVIFQVRYRTTSMQRYDEYRANHAPRLQAEHTNRYGTRVTAMRTVHVAEQQT
ncbi:MAG: DUF4286 family protein [Candidatus Kapabacteria bacterium]|nr:DUF4286 family protein [Candidatus Kapabacteria bacterium]